MPENNEKLLGEIQETLKTYKEKIDAQITTLTAQQSDKANAEIAKLTAELDKVKTALEGMKTAGKGFGLPGLEAKDAEKFSWQRFFLAQYVTAARAKGCLDFSGDPFDKLAPAEKDMCKSYMDIKKKDFQEQVNNLTMLKFGSEIVDKAYNATDGSSGGFLVPQQAYQGPIVDVVYAQTPILNFPGVLKLTGLMGDIPIPKDLSNLTAYMVGENGKPTVTDSTFGEEWLRPKKMGIFTKVSNRLIAYTNNAAESIIRNKMTRDASVKVSQQLVSGSGSAYEVKGLEKNLTGMTAGTAIGSNGGRFTVDTAASMKQSLAVANELRDTNTYAYLLRPEALWGMLRERVLMYSGGTTKAGMPVAPGKMLLDVNEIQAALKAQFGHTTQLAKNLTKGTSSTCSRVFYGDWSQYCFATFREPSFRVSDVAGDGSTGSAFLEDMLYMVMFWEFDAALLRPAAMCYIADAETTESSWA